MGGVATHARLSLGRKSSTCTKCMLIAKDAAPVFAVPVPRPRGGEEYSPLTTPALPARARRVLNAPRPRDGGTRAHQPDVRLASRALRTRPGRSAQLSAVASGRRSRRGARSEDDNFPLQPLTARRHAPLAVKGARYARPRGLGEKFSVFAPSSTTLICADQPTDGGAMRLPTYVSRPAIDVGPQWFGDDDGAALVDLGSGRVLGEFRTTATANTTSGSMPRRGAPGGFCARRPAASLLVALSKMLRLAGQAEGRDEARAEIEYFSGFGSAEID